jgi:hypothetical protein
MSDYIKITDYAAKDALLTGNPSKLVKGTEIGADLDAVAVAVATKFDSTDLGVTVQAYDADLTTWAGVTPGTGIATALAVNVGTAGSPVINGGVLGTPSSGTVTNLTGTASININGTVGATTPTTAEFTTATVNTSIELGHASDTTLTRVSAGLMAVEGATVATLSTDQTWTGAQRGTVTADNDLSFDLSVTNNFSCTPSAGGTLTFTNIASSAGQSGLIKLVNGSNYAIAAHANTKVGTSTLSTISASGTYLLTYLCDGTNVYVVSSGALA